MPWKLTVRTGSRVEHARFDALRDALDAIEVRARELAEAAPQDALGVELKRFQPIQRVAARIELAGPERLMPSVRAGVDVRADGSTEAYLGRVRRRIVERRKRETPYAALRRSLLGDDSAVAR